MARSFALVRPVLHRVCETTKRSQMYLNGNKLTKHMRFGSNGVDRVCSLRKIPMQLRGTNFCTSSARFVLSFVRQPNGSEFTQIVRNALKHQFRVQWGGSDAFVAKNYEAPSWHELLHHFGPFCTEFRKTTKRSRMHPHSTQCTKTAV